mgnify:CR=1 FL=1
MKARMYLQINTLRIRPIRTEKSPQGVAISNRRFVFAEVDASRLVVFLASELPESNAITDNLGRASEAAASGDEKSYRLYLGRALDLSHKLS